MMGRNGLLGCLLLCLMALGVNAIAADPNMITAASRPDGTYPTPLVVNGGFETGCLPYVDRTYVMGEVGDFAGLDYVQMSMDGRQYDGTSTYYDITVDKAGRLFLLIDNRVGDSDASNPPTLGEGKMDWVLTDGFVATSYEIPGGAGAGEACTVYQKEVTAGTYTLKEQNDTTGRAQYQVVAAPAGWELPNTPPFIQGVPSSQTLIPGQTLPIDATITDDGAPNPPATVTVQWTVESQPDGSSVTFDPDMVSEDVTVSFTGMGDYTLKIAASDSNMIAEQLLDVTVSLPIYAIEATHDIEYGNDSSLSSTSRSNGSGLGIRNTDNRRRVIYARYDLSELEPLDTDEVYTNTFLSTKGHDISDNIQVFGIKEHLDGYDISSGSWSTAPGLPNEPVPASNTPVALDPNDTDLTDELLNFDSPALGVRESTAPSIALADYINEDTDDVLILMLIELTDGDGSIVRSIEHTDTSYSPPDSTEEYDGIVIGVSKQVPTWATNPTPDLYASASGVTEVSWTNPPQPVGTITADVYFGTEPNALEDHLGLTHLGSTTGNTMAVSVDPKTRYYWVVDVTDSGTGETIEGNLWTFDTNNGAPEVNAGDDQYVWLNNAGDPATSTTTLDGTVSDDGLPSGQLTIAWTQISGDTATFNGPTDQEDVSITLPGTGTYSFQLTADDTAVSNFDIVDVIVEDTPCDAAKAKPNYEATDGDINDDCFVNLDDFVLMAANWLVCHPYMDASCN